MSEMRTNINVKEFLGDTNKKWKYVMIIKYSHEKSRKEFGTNRVFLSI